MKTVSYLKIAQGLTLTIMAVYCGLVQPGVLSESDYMRVPVTPGAHRQQAREILGELWMDSFALRPDPRKFAAMIYNQAESQLPDDFKKLAHKVTRSVLAESLSQKLDPLFLLAMIRTESRFNPNALGGHGEIGLLQIRPNTAKWIAEQAGLEWLGKDALRDPEYNIRIGAAYLSHLRSRFLNKAADYISAYNMGVTKLLELKKQSIQPAIYMNHVKRNYRFFNSELRALATGKSNLYAELTE